MINACENDNDWTVSDEIEYNDTMDNNVDAESAFDYLACEFGTSSVTSLEFCTLRNEHSDSLAAQMLTLFNSIMSEVLQYLVDPHQRISYAVCNAIGHCYNLFLTHLRKKFHEQVMDYILGVLAHAVASLDNFKLVENGTNR